MGGCAAKAHSQTHRLGRGWMLSKFITGVFGTKTRASAGMSARTMACMQNKKGRSHDLPFLLNKPCFCAVIAVQQRCCIRLFGRFLPKLRPPSQAAFFA